jgi:replicative DNA helicase
VASPEALLISSVLRNKDFAEAVAEGITPKMFNGYPDEWTFIEKFVSKHKKVPSKVAFRDAFPDFRIKEADDTIHFSERVKKDYTKRVLTQSIHETTDLMSDGKIDDAVAFMSSNIVTIASITGNLDDKDAVANFGDVYRDVEARVKRAKKHGSSGVKTGFSVFDRITGGLQPGTLTIVGARLGEGKSYAMQHMSVTNLLNKKTVQFDALEQTATEVKMRMHSLLSARIDGLPAVSASSLMRGEGVELAKYKSMLKKTKRELSGSALHIADSSRGQIGLMTVAAQIERNRPDVVYIDYLTLMQKKGNEWQDVGELTRGLKNLAQQYQIPIVAAAQLNRQATMGKDPAGAETLAQSDNIGQDADYIITIKKKSPSTLAMRLAKNRNGVGDQRWWCHFNPDKGIFRTISYQKMMEIQDQEADDAERESEMMDEDDGE